MWRVIFPRTHVDLRYNFKGAQQNKQKKGLGIHKILPNLSNNNNNNPYLRIKYHLCSSHEVSLDISLQSLKT